LTVLKAVFRQNVAVTVNDVVQALKPVSDDPAIRRIIRTTWVYLLNSAQHLKNNAEPLLETFRNVVGGQIMQTMAEVWKAEGKAEGEVIGVLKGKAEGETIGALKGKAEAVLRILARQQGPVPPSLAERIRAITNIERLDELFELAFDCKSLKEFSDHLS
ncbi:DUF4351 domain-containing protein, partial [Desulfosarcina sp. OttesenSCG-928-B08]|nr:DUF4351 domain-containing protein [Desulfosarcina sp. OttesenSCG-928-B08]